MAQMVQNSGLQFNNYLITKSSIEIKDPSIGQEMEFQIHPVVKVGENNVYNIILNVVTYDIHHNIEIAVDIVGIFTCGETEEKLVKLISLTPALMFPYVRAYITTMTASAGIVPPIILPTYNVTKLGETVAELLKAELAEAQQ